ncbi:hypothetical protein [Nocardia sp. CA-290969]|uniref:hypothetical protein n=1 Tax=Nocardia sp. CA-290969 TaxID=3239986 RepID=UPI003D9439C3
MPENTTTAELLAAIDLVDELAASVENLHPGYTTQRAGLSWLRGHVREREFQHRVGEAVKRRIPDTAAGPVYVGAAIAAAIADIGYTLVVSPEQIRTVLGAAWDAGNGAGLDGWVGPAHPAGDASDEAVYRRNRAVEAALVQLRYEVPNV